MKWRRLRSGALHSKDAAVFKNADGSYFVWVSNVFATEREAKQWAKSVLSVDSSNKPCKGIARIEVR